MSYPDPVQPYPDNKFRAEPRPPNWKKKRHTGRRRFVAVVLAVVLGILGAVVGYAEYDNNTTTSEQN